MINTLNINTPYIKLEQFLKLIDLVSSGGEAKLYLEDNYVLINEEKDNRRGRKLYPGDLIEIDGEKYQICMLER